MELVKNYAAGEEQCLEVLYALQVTVRKLSHPPSKPAPPSPPSAVATLLSVAELLDEMFNIVYNTEVVGEDDFLEWYQSGTELYGRGTAVMSVKSFFDWLKLDEDSQNAT